MKNTELEKVVLESGLSISESEQIKQSYLPFFIQIAEIKEESKKINFENPTELDEKIARELRLRMVKIRTGSATVKDERKKIHLLRGNLEQSSWNLIKTGCELEEEIFFQVEKKREITEKLRKENLKNERLELLKDVCENSEIYPLSEMEEESFNDLFEALKIAKQQKEEKEKAELLRIENERIEREKAIEEQRLENERLKQEAEKREKELDIERKKAIKEKEAIELKAKQEAEKRESEIIKRGEEACSFLEKLGFDYSLDNNGMYSIYFSKGKPYMTFLQYRKDIFWFEQKSSLDGFKLQVEAEIKSKEIENKLKIKEESDFIIEKERIAKEQAEKLAKEQAEKAPIKDKLKLWVTSFNIENSPIDNQATKLINEKFEAFKKWAITNIESI